MVLIEQSSEAVAISSSNMGAKSLGQRSGNEAHGKE